MIPQYRKGNFIYEVAIYDGGMKNWRILNLNTGTFYNMEYKTQKAADRAINAGEKRGNQTVVAIPIESVYNCVRHVDEAI